MLELKMAVNSMVAQISTLGNEVVRVSLEVGTDGILANQATVPVFRGCGRYTLFLPSLV